jgi:hypothetical protein
MDEHQCAFEAIKSLVVSRECLMVIDHSDLGDNKVFIMCDASDWCTGATLSFAPTWETAHPMAFDSMQLKRAKKNYPVHEKELLTIIRALKHWRSDLLRTEFVIYTDHCTLENFDTQRNLSRQQLHWQEFLSQYDFCITYIHREDNTVADALSCLPPCTFPDKFDNNDAPHLVWGSSVNATLSVTTDTSVLQQIKSGYNSNSFCTKITSSGSQTRGVHESNGLWYIGASPHSKNW